ncbi:MAG: hypothetical protein ACR2QC_09740, partial [Gammaproteobacteria bacterium]
MSNWTQYDSEESVDVLKRIVNDNDSAAESCVALLKAAKDSRRFVAHVRSLIEGAGGRVYPGKHCPQFLEKLNEEEYKNPPWKFQGRKLWDSMKDMPPIDACRPGLWLYVTLHAIESGAIESHYLAAGSNGAGQTGSSRIDEALSTGKHLDVLGRLVLRRMFGSISQRGVKAIYTDIPFAKIWWQRHISEEIARGGVGISADEMTALFAGPKRGFIYADLTTSMSSAKTVIADKPIRDGLMHFVFHAVRNEKIPAGFSIGGEKHNFRVLIRRLGVMLAWRAMGAMDALENSDIVGECAAEIGRG